MTEIVKIKVVKVQENGYEVVINKGSDYGIKMGQRYLVYEIGEEIIDPDTRLSLGSIEIVKGRGTVTHVQEKMATITSDEHDYQIEKIKHSPLFSAYGASSEKRVKVDHPFSNPNIGDIVKLI